MDAVRNLQHCWEVIKYNMAENKQEDAFAELAKDARRVSEQYPGKAEPLVWEGIILSTYTGAKGGLGALSIVKTTRERLQQAETKDPNVLHAPSRQGRELADSRRRNEIAAIIEDVKRML